MDKLRFKQPSGFSGGVEVLPKSNKERIKKLSTIGSWRFQMGGCRVSNDDDELPTKFSIHLGSSVPRKLRSAMKNRRRQSTSPYLPRKLTSGIKSLGCNGVKRPCLKQGDRGDRETVNVTITKDEEEVVETLYALAGLVFLGNEVNGVSKVDSEDLDVNGSALPEAKDSPKPTVEVKLDPDLPCIADISTSHLDLLSNPGTQYQQELPNSGEFCIASENNICMSQTNISSLSSKIEQCSEKPFGNTIYFHDPSESSLESRLKQTEEQKTSLFCRKPESSVEMGTNIGCQVKKHDMLQKSGSGLWPGLSLNVSHTWSDSPHKQRTVATLPLLMDAPCSTSVVQVPNGPFVKVTKVVNGRRSCKKCAAHVYISLLIQALKRSANIDKLMVQPNQREHEGLRQGGFVGVNTSINVKRCFNEAVSSSSTCISTAENVPNEAKNGIHQHKKLHLDQQVFGAHTSPKQTVDFLSLSAGGGSLENIDSFSRGRRGMELLSQAQLPYLPSSVQHHNVIPFSLTRTHYSSSASFDRSSVAQQSQLLPSYGNSFCGPKANATALTKQPIHHQQLHHQQQQQLHMLQQHRHQQQQQLHLQQRQQPQQQRLWAAQLATQYRPAGTLAATVPSPSWQNMKQENGKPIQRSQAFLSPSPSTLELVGPKFASLSHQQQQLMTVPSSFPPGRVKWQDHHLPSVYEESASGYRSACSLPLQLLCNDRL